MKRSRNTLYATSIIFIFLIGIILGWQLGDTSLQESQVALKKSELDLRSFSLQFEHQDFFQNDVCSAEILESVQFQLYESALELDALERQNKVDTENYDFLKRLHNVNQVLFYLKYRDFSERCGEEANDIILFLFNASEPALAAQQGRSLDNIVKQKDVIVIPMDYGYTEEIDFFYEVYDISTLPVLVINYNTILQGIHSEEIVANALEQ